MYFSLLYPAAISRSFTMPLMARVPALVPGLKLAAALFLVWSAIGLWRTAGRHAAAGLPPPATPGRVFLTTLLNPKAMVFALVLLPAVGSPDHLPRLGLFCGLVAAAALLWGTSGALTRLGDSGARRLFVLQRLAASWLVVVAVTLLGGVLAA